MTSRLPACCLIVLGALLSGCNQSATLVALTSTGRILEFTSEKPASISEEVTVSGLASGVSLVQIAYRPATGDLYGVTSTNQLATVDLGSGVATLVDSSAVFSSATLANVHAAWNPVTDLLRVTATGYNLTVASTGVLESTDTALAFGSSDTNASKTPQPAAIAYTNAASGASSSTLYALDVTTQDLLAVGTAASRDGAATGVLTTIGAVGTLFSNAGFAIQPSANTAYAVLAAQGSGASLYTLDLDTGLATYDGVVGSDDQTIISMTVPP